MIEPNIERKYPACINLENDSYPHVQEKMIAASSREPSLYSSGKQSRVNLFSWLQTMSRTSGGSGVQSKKAEPKADKAIVGTSPIKTVTSSASCTTKRGECLRITV